MAKHEKSPSALSKVMDKSKNNSKGAAKSPVTPEAAPAAAPVTEVTPMASTNAASTNGTSEPKRKGRKPGQVVKAAIPASLLVEAALSADSLDEFEKDIARAKGTPERVHIRRAITDLEEKGLTGRKKHAVEVLRSYALKHDMNPDSMRGAGGAVVRAAPKAGETRPYRTVTPGKGGKFVRVASITDAPGYFATFNADGSILLKPGTAADFKRAEANGVPANGQLYNASAEASA